MAQIQRFLIGVTIALVLGVSLQQQLQSPLAGLIRPPEDTGFCTSWIGQSEPCGNGCIDNITQPQTQAELDAIKLKYPDACDGCNLAGEGNPCQDWCISYEETECDFGDDNDDSAYCKSDCTFAVCGDDIINESARQGVKEECEQIGAGPFDYITDPAWIDQFDCSGPGMVQAGNLLCDDLSCGLLDTRSCSFDSEAFCIETRGDPNAFFSDFGDGQFPPRSQVGNTPPEWQNIQNEPEMIFSEQSGIFVANFSGDEDEVPLPSFPASPEGTTHSFTVTSFGNITTPMVLFELNGNFFAVNSTGHLQECQGHQMNCTTIDAMPNSVGTNPIPLPAEFTIVHEGSETRIYLNGNLIHTISTGADTDLNLAPDTTGTSFDPFNGSIADMGAFPGAMPETPQAGNNLEDFDPYGCGQRPVDYTVHKTANPDSVDIGQPIRFEIHVMGIGESDSENPQFTVSDVIPAVFENVTIVNDGGHDCSGSNGNNVSCLVDQSLPLMEERFRSVGSPITIEANVVEDPQECGTTVTNTAIFGAADHVPENNTSSVNVDIPDCWYIDFTVNAVTENGAVDASGNPVVGPGEFIVYTYTITNSGNIDSPYTIFDYTPDPNTSDEGTYNCDFLGNIIPAGVTQSCQYARRVNPDELLCGTTISQSATLTVDPHGTPTVMTPDPVDPVTHDVVCVDLAVDLTDSPNAGGAGDNPRSFESEVTNHGPQDAGGATLMQYVFGGFYNLSEPTGGPVQQCSALLYNRPGAPEDGTVHTQICGLGPLTVATAEVLSSTADGTYSSRVTKCNERERFAAARIDSRHYDTDTSNNFDILYHYATENCRQNPGGSIGPANGDGSVRVPSEQVDLWARIDSLQHLGDNQPIVATVTLTNSGPGTAEAVVFNAGGSFQIDTLQMDGVDCTSPVGTPGECVVGDMASGESRTFTITSVPMVGVCELHTFGASYTTTSTDVNTTPDTPNPLHQFVQLGPSGCQDGAIQPQAVLGVQIAIPQVDSAINGDLITVRYTVENQSLTETATDVRLVVGGGLSIPFVSGPDCNSGMCTIPDLAPGATHSVDVVFRINFPFIDPPCGPRHQFYGSATASNTPQSVSRVPFDVPCPELRVNVVPTDASIATAVPPVFPIGSNQFRVTVHNDGPGRARNVRFHYTGSIPTVLHNPSPHTEILYQNQPSCTRDLNRNTHLDLVDCPQFDLLPGESREYLVTMSYPPDPFCLHELYYIAAVTSDSTQASGIQTDDIDGFFGDTRCVENFEITIDHQPDVGADEPIEFTVRVHNLDIADVRDVTIGQVLPPEIDPASIAIEQIDPDNDTPIATCGADFCNNGSINLAADTNPGDTIAFIVRGRTFPTPTFDCVAADIPYTVTVDTILQTGRNAATARTPVNCGVDIGVDLSGPPSFVTGQNTVTVNIRNYGQSMAENVAWTHLLPSDATIVNIDDNHGGLICQGETDPVSCSGFQLAPAGVTGDVATFTVLLDFQIGPSCGQNADYQVDITTDSLQHSNVEQDSDLHGVQYDCALPFDIQIDDDPTIVGQSANLSYIVTVQNMLPTSQTSVNFTNTFDIGIDTTNIAIYEVNPSDTAVEIGPCGTDFCNNGGITLNPNGQLSDTVAYRIDVQTHQDPPFNCLATDFPFTFEASSDLASPFSVQETTDVDCSVIETDTEINTIATLGNIQRVQDIFPYEVTLYNSGPVDAVDTIVEVVLPPEIELHSANIDGSIVGCDVASGRCTIPLIPTAGQPIVTFNLSAPAVDASSCTIDTTIDATITAPEDPTTNDYDNLRPVSIRCATYDIQKTSTVIDQNADSLFGEGDHIQYDITVTNNGDVDGGPTSIRDNLPEGMTVISVTETDAVIGDQCRTFLASNTVVCGYSDGELPPLGSMSVTIVARYDPPSTCAQTITNETRVSAGYAFPAIHSGFDSGVTVDGPCGNPDLDVRLTDIDQATVGSTIRYFVDIANRGLGKATDVSVSPSLSGLRGTIVSLTDDATVNPVNCNGATCDLFDLLPGESRGFFVEVVPNSCDALTPLVFDITAAAIETDDPDTHPNTATDSVDVFCQPDLSLSATVASQPISHSTAHSMTLTVSNAGVGDAPNVNLLLDAFPAGTTLQNVQGTNGAVCNGDPLNFSCDVATLTDGQSFDIQADVFFPESACGQVHVIGATASTTLTDPDTTNDTQDLSFTVACDDVYVVKTSSDQLPHIGRPFDYTITVHNPTGLDIADSIRIVDILPSEVTLTNVVEDTGWTCEATGVDCLFIDTLPAGGSTSITATVQIDNVSSCSQSSMTNTVQMDIGDDQVDIESSDQVLPIDCADLEVIINDAPDPALLWDSSETFPGVVRHVVSITNNGQDTAANTSAEVTLPTEFVPWRALVVRNGGNQGVDACTIVGQVVTCPTSYIIPAGRTDVIVESHVHINACRTTPQVTVQFATDTYDLATGTQETTEDTDVHCANVTGLITPSVNPVQCTDPLAFTIDISNDNHQMGSEAEDIVVSFELEDGMDFIDLQLQGSPVSCVSEPPVLGRTFWHCDLDTFVLAQNRTETLTLNTVVRPNSGPTTLSSNFFVYSPSDGTSFANSLQTNVDGSCLPPGDLHIDLVGPVTAEPDTSVTYTLTVENRSTVSPVEDIQLWGVIPNGLTITSIEDSTARDCTADFCDGFDLSPQSSESYTITADIGSLPCNHGNLIYEVRGQSLQIPAVFDTATTQIQCSNQDVTEGDINITKIASSPILSLDEAFTYSIIIRNLDEFTTAVLDIIDPSPANISYTSVTGNHGGACSIDTSVDSSGILSCPGLRVSYGTPVTITINAHVENDNQACGQRTNTLNPVSFNFTDTTTGDDLEEQVTVDCGQVGESDIAITSFPTPSPANEGDTVPMTVDFVNNGPDPAPDAEFIVTLPAEASLNGDIDLGAEWQCSQNRCSRVIAFEPTAPRGFFAWLFSNLLPLQGQQALFDVDIAPDACANANQIPVTVEVRPVGANDPTPNVLTRNIILNCGGGGGNADLEIRTTVDSTPYRISENIYVHVDLINNSGVDAEGVTVTESLDPRFILNGTSTRVVGTIPDGTSQRVTFQYKTDIVQTSCSLDEQFTALITTTTTDSNVGNNDLVEQVQVACGEISIDKVITSDTTNFGEGDSVTYQLTATNVAQVDPGPYQIMDLMPAGMVVTNVTPPECRVSADMRVTCAYPDGSLPNNGDTEVVTIDATYQPVTVPCADTILNEARTIGGYTFPVFTFDDESFTRTGSCNSPDLETTVRGPSTVAVGQANYRVRVENRGTALATGVDVSSQISGLAGSVISVTDVSDGSACPLDFCDPFDLSPQQFKEFDVTVDITTCGATPLTFSASVALNETENPDAYPNTGAVDTQVNCFTNIEVTGNAPGSIIPAGLPQVFNYTVTNHGPGDAPGVHAIHNAFPAGTIIQNVDVTPIGAANCTDASPVVDCDPASLAAGDSFTVTAEAVFPESACGAQHNVRFSASDSSVPEPRLDDNSVILPFSVGCTQNAYILKEVNDIYPRINDVITYTLTVDNPTIDDEPSVAIQDTLPQGLDLIDVRFNATDWTCNPQAVSLDELVCTYNGTLPAQTRASAIELDVELSDTSICGTSPDNTARLSASVTHSSSVPVHVNCADISVAVSDTPDPATIGDTVTYTTAFSNAGPNPAWNMVYTADVPSDFQVRSANITYGSTHPCAIQGQRVTCPAFVQLTAGTPVLTVEAVPLQSTCNTTQTFTAGFTTSTYDLATAPGTPVEQTNIECADLTAQFVNITDPVQCGDTASFPLEVSNAGSVDAENVRLTMVLDEGMHLIDIVGANAMCSIDPNHLGAGTRLLCTLSTNVPALSSQTYMLRATMLPVSATPVAANISVDVGASNLVTGGGASTQGSTTVEGSCSAPNDIAIDITGPAQIDAVDSYTYTVTVTNMTLLNATDIQITDVIPADVTITDIRDSANTSCIADYCSGFILLPGASEVFTVSADANFQCPVSPDPAYEVRASSFEMRQGGDPTALDVERTPVSCHGGAQETDLSIVDVSFSTSPIAEAETSQVEIQIDNLTQVDPLTVNLTIMPDASLTTVALPTFDVGQWNCSERFDGLISCNSAVGLFVTPVTATLEVQANTGICPIADASITASVATGRTDRNMSNNDGDATVDIDCSVDSGDIHVVKTATLPNDPLFINDVFTYEITLTNNETSDMTLDLSDIAPTGINFRAVTPLPAACTLDDVLNTFVCDDLVIAPGDTVFTITAEATAQSCGTVTNGVSITDMTDTSAGDILSVDTDVDCAGGTNGDITVTKTATLPNDPLNQYQPFTYTIDIVVNDGQSHVLDLTDIAPSDIRFVSPTLPPECTFDSVANSVVCVDLPVPDTGLTIDIAAESTAACGQFANTVSVTNFTDSSANDDLTEVVTVRCPGDGGGGDQTDLAVDSISFDWATIVPGDTSYVELELDHVSGDTAVNPVLEITFPAELSLDSQISFSDGNWTCQGFPVVRCDAPLMDTDVTVTFDVLLADTGLCPPNSVDLLAEIDTDTTDISPGNNDSVGTLNVDCAGGGGPTVTIDKTVDDSTPAPGSFIHYTFDVHNTDAVNIISNISITDTLPAGYIFVPESIDQSICNLSTADTIDCYISQLDPDQRLTFTASVEIPLDMGLCTSVIDNTAILSVDGTEDDRSTASATITCTDENGLLFDKSSSTPSPTIGTTFNYRFVFVNQTVADDLDAVVLHDTLPAGLALDTANLPTGCVASGNNDEILECSLGSLVQAAPTLALDVPVLLANDTALCTVPPTVLVNDAYTDFEVGATPHSTTHHSATVTPHCPPGTVDHGDVTFTKTVDTLTPAPNDTVTYTITATNNDNEVHTFTIVDTAPADVTFTNLVGAPPECVLASNTVTCTDLRLPALGQGVFSIEATVEQTACDATPRTNTFTVQNFQDTNLSDNVMSVDITADCGGGVDTEGDVTFEKTVSVSTANLLESFEYTITITNNEPGTTKTVDLLDTAPAGVIFQGPVGIPGCSLASNEVTCTAIDVTEGTPIILTIPAEFAQDATAPACGDTMTNTLVIQNFTDTDTTDDTLSVDITRTCPSADLQVTPQAAGSVAAGDLVTLTADFLNNGPEDAPDAFVEMVLPDGLIIEPGTVAINGSTNSWTCHQPTDRVEPADRVMRCESERGLTAFGGSFFARLLAFLNQVDRPSITLDAHTSVSLCPVGGVVTTDVAVGTVSANDPDDTNDTGTIDTTITCPRTSMTVAKTVDNVTPRLGEAVVFTLEVENDGDTALTNIEITETLDAGLAYALPAPAGCTIDAVDTQIMTCDVLDLAALGVAQIHVPVLIDPNSGICAAASQDLLNQISVTADNVGAETANETVTVDCTTGGNSNMSFSKNIVHPASKVAAPGDTVRYQFFISNQSVSDTALGVVFTDTLPVGLSFTDDLSAITECQYTDQAPHRTVECDYGDMQPFDNDILRFDAVVDPAYDCGPTDTATLTNRAELTVDGTFDQRVTDDLTVDCAGGGGGSQPNVTFTKEVVSAEPVQDGDVLEYTVTITNNSTTDDIPEYKVTDTIPIGMSFDTLDPRATQGCTAAGQSIECIVSELLATDTVVFTFIVNVDNFAGLCDVQPTAHSNTADMRINTVVVASDTANVTFDVCGQGAVSSAVSSKTVDRSVTQLGSAVHYEVTVENDGDTQLTNVDLTDTLDAGLTVVTPLPVGCDNSTDPQIIECDLPNMNRGAGVHTLDLVATVDPLPANCGLDLTNTVSVTADELAAPVDVPAVPTNIDCTLSPNNLLFSKTIIDPAGRTLLPGGTVRYQFHVHNLGATDVDDVRIEDQVPTELTVTSDFSGLPFPCAVDASNLLSCSVGTLTPGQSHTFIVEANVDAAYTCNTQPDIVLQNAAKVLVAGVDDVLDADDLTVDCANIGLANVFLDKRVVTQLPVSKGDEVVFEIDIDNRNVSESIAGLQLTDSTPVIPALQPSYVLTFNPSDARATSGCVYGNGNYSVECFIADLPPGVTTYTFVATVLDDDAVCDPVVTTDYPNIVSLRKGVDTIDTDTEQVTVDTCGGVVTADVDVEAQTMTAAPTNLDVTDVANNTSTVTATVLNSGTEDTDDTQNVTVTSALPTGVTLDTASIVADAKWDCAASDADHLECVLLASNTFAASETATFEFDVEAHPAACALASVDVPVEIVSDDDNDGTNNTAQTTLTLTGCDAVPDADLELVSASTDVQVLAPDADVTVTAIYQNNGPDTATDAEIESNIPPGLTLDTANITVDTGWDCSQSSASKLHCMDTDTVARVQNSFLQRLFSSLLGDGTPRIISFKATANSDVCDGVALTGFDIPVEISSQNVNDTVDNNTKTASVGIDCSSVTPTGPVTLTKTKVGSLTVNPGEEVVFHLDVTNNTSTATGGIKVVDNPDSPITFTNTTVPTACVVSQIDDDVECELPSDTALAANGSLRFTLTGSIANDLGLLGSTIENKAEVFVNGEKLDTTAIELTVAGGVNPDDRADILVQAVNAGDTTPNPGDTVTVTVPYANLGPDAATNPTLTATMPSDVTLQTSVLSDLFWDCTGSTPSQLSCTQTSLAVTGNQTPQLSFNVTIGSNINSCTTAVTKDISVTIGSLTVDPQTGNETKTRSLAVQCVNTGSNNNGSSSNSSNSNNNSSSNSSSSNNNGTTSTVTTNPVTFQTPIFQQPSAPVIPFAPPVQAPVSPAAPAAPGAPVAPSAPVVPTPDTPVVDPIGATEPETDPQPELPETVVSPAPQVAFEPSPSPYCGDGVLQVQEECDAGRENSNTAPNACRLNCTIAHCGDGVKDPGEQCDGTSDCTSDCRFVQGNTRVGRTPQRPNTTPTPNPVTAQVAPVTHTHAPVGDTGPGAIIAVALGAAGGWVGMRRRKKRG